MQTTVEWKSTTACPLASLDFAITDRCLHEYALAHAGNGDNLQRKSQSDGTEHCWRESVDFCSTGNAQPGKGTPPPVRKNQCFFDSNGRSIEWYIAR